ncbi:MAG: sigma-54-dependent Fis family transcriptional regulator [Polyangiaceae bacterium]
MERVQAEKQLLQKLLELGTKDEMESFLEEALGLIVEIARARRGYLEIRDETDTARKEPFWIARGCSEEDVAEVRSAFSSGVIAEAIARGRTIATVSALEDPRFRDRRSVRKNRIEAVLCAPVGAPPLGVLYLQDREEPGPFSEDDERHAEIFARHVTTLADRLLLRRRAREERSSLASIRSSLHADRMVGRSDALGRLLQQVSHIAPLDISVLLSGPTGCGKTAVARLIHDNSPRASRQFIEINCASLPETLTESELFGAMPGAHSTASRRVQGKVEAANGGTLFLDEVAELLLPTQAKLLQLLQSKEYYPLGASRPLFADIRVIAATNADLRAAVAKKAFREDLFYRLQVLPLRVPSLAERPEDVPALAAHFVDAAIRRHGLPRMEFSAGALSTLEITEWPGNIRELMNVVEAAAVRAAVDGLLRIEKRHLFPDDAPSGEGGTEPAGRDRAGKPSTLQAATRQFQAALVLRTLEETGWNITEASAKLDIARSHLYNLIRTFGLERKKGS